jgi:hypothetical protein
MTATARAYRLLTPNAGNELVRSGVRRNPSRHIYTGKDLKMLSAVATKTSGGALYLTIVNKARAWRVSRHSQGPRQTDPIGGHQGAGRAELPLLQQLPPPGPRLDPEPQAVGQVPHDEAEGPGALGHDPEAPALEQVGS